MPGLLTPADVRRLLAEHGLAPHKALGQNFVVDPNTVRKVVRAAGVRPGDLVVEVGAGLGSLTIALRAAEARVIAVEVDAGMVRALGDVVGTDPGVTVLHADALAIDFAALTCGQPAALVANLPYNVATPIVMTALVSGAFGDLLVMVQKEVGQRWAARVGDPLYAGVSVKVAALAEACLAGSVSRNAFYPVPNVDSVLVRLRAKAQPETGERQSLFEVVDTGFRQRRKRLRNALASPQHPPASIEAALRTAGLDTGARAEELDLEGFVALTSALRP
ncbi:MAG: 16S rRNA (adenine(1518)-N(6)/adenine(1519)-N(6))-dimethyltransferase RsmA [Actinomycetota bacterium]|nr:16S rRNA (adenine(1518)-N(6)/adenine(1519)-N(6))-dimethyltransferase RsmA [Actinomycetota bacterium]